MELVPHRRVDGVYPAPEAWGRVVPTTAIVARTPVSDRLVEIEVVAAA